MPAIPNDWKETLTNSMSIMHSYSPYNHCMRERSKTMSIETVDPYYVTMTLTSLNVTITLVCALSILCVNIDAWHLSSTVQCDRHQITYWGRRGEGVPLYIIHRIYTVFLTSRGAPWPRRWVVYWPGQTMMKPPPALPTFRRHTHTLAIRDKGKII